MSSTMVPWLIAAGALAGYLLVVFGVAVGIRVFVPEWDDGRRQWNDEDVAMAAFFWPFCAIAILVIGPIWLTISGMTSASKAIATRVRHD